MHCTRWRRAQQVNTEQRTVTLNARGMQMYKLRQQGSHLTVCGMPLAPSTLKSERAQSEPRRQWASAHPARLLL